MPDKRKERVLGFLLGFGEERDLSGKPGLSLHAAHDSESLVCRGNRFGVAVSEEVFK